MNNENGGRIQKFGAADVHLRRIFAPKPQSIMPSTVGTLLWAFAVLAAGPAVGHPELQTGASRVALASVTDPGNKPLVDVSADDFVIQEAGVAREILSVRPADYPIVVLLDTGVDA